MKKTLILTLAATIVSGAATLSTAAHAGNGVKLYFNGPLGSFVARPSKGHGSASNYLAAKKAHKSSTAYAARQANEVDTPSSSAAKHAKKSTTVANTASKSRKVYREDKDENESAENGPTGSKALLQTDTAQVAAVEPPASTPAETNTAPVAEAYGPPAPEATVTEVTAPAETTVAEAKTEAPKTAEKREDDSDKCKKFIPAVGVTISVGC